MDRRDIKFFRFNEVFIILLLLLLFLLYLLLMLFPLCWLVFIISFYIIFFFVLIFYASKQCASAALEFRTNFLFKLKMLNFEKLKFCTELEIWQKH